MRKLVVGIVVAILICTGLIVVTNKYQIEERNKTVELTADYDLFAEFDQVQLLEQFSGQTLTSLALTEQSLEQLAAQNRISIYRGDYLQDLKEWGLALNDIDSIERDNLYIRGPSALLEQIEPRLKRVVDVTYLDHKQLLIIEETRRNLLAKPICFNPKGLKFSQKTALQLVPRFKSTTSIAEVELILNKLENVGTTIFSGRQVVGYPQQLEQLARTLQLAGIKLGLIESFLARQTGSDFLAEEMDYRAVRVHSIQQEELSDLGVTGAVERYFKAVQERNVRLLYLKPFERVEQTVEFIRRLREKLEQSGYNLAAAKPFSPVPQQKFLKSVIIVLLIILLAIILSTRNLLKIVPLILGSGCLLVVLYWLDWQSSLAIVALLVAIIVPSLEAIYLLSKCQKENLVQTLFLFFSVSLVSIATGLVITALLVDNSYLLQIRQFRGVKLAFSLPLILVSGYYLLKERRVGVDEIKSSLKSSITWWQLVVVISLGLAGLIYLTRTGNQALLGVTKLELAIRDFLTNIFRVRPRFKSFLIGHPLLLLGIHRADDKFSPWLLIGGLIGQVNIINSLVHLHTPIKISLWRVGIGVVLGVVLGVIVDNVELISRGG